MNYCYHTRALVERPRDTLVKLEYQWGQNEIQYCSEVRALVEPPKDAVVTLACQLPIGNEVTLWYHVSHHDILYWHKGNFK